MANAVNRLTGREGTITVSRTVLNQETEEKLPLDVRPFVTDPARVQVRLGRTINIGNYESARIDIGIDLPCYREEVATVYPELMARVAALMSQEIGKLEAAGVMEAR